VISLKPDINVSAIGVKSREPLRILDMVFISPLVDLPKNQVQALLYEIYNLQLYSSNTPVLLEIAEIAGRFKRLWGKLPARA
jgi:hypothetical protein